MIISSLIIIGKILLLAYFITRFEPLQLVLQTLSDRYKNLFMIVLYLILSCFKCTSFWVGLILFQSIYLGIIAFIIAFIYDKKLSLWETKITFK